MRRRACTRDVARIAFPVSRQAFCRARGTFSRSPERQAALLSDRIGTHFNGLAAPVVHRTRIKICGITRPEDARCAVAGGADAIGLVFYGPSPRCVSAAQAREICAVLPPFVVPVGLFVDADADAVNTVLAEVPLGLLQFHGSEAPAYCEGFDRPYMKALRMRPDIDVEAEARRYHSAAGLLLDSYKAGVPGGTGETFDWQRVPLSLRQRIVLAGGLNPDNVGAAVAELRPYAVDVSGGVEHAPGCKDPEKIARFVAAVGEADRR